MKDYKAERYKLIVDYKKYEKKCEEQEEYDKINYMDFLELELIEARQEIDEQQEIIKQEVIKFAKKFYQGFDPDEVIQDDLNNLLEQYGIEEKI